MVLSVFKKFLYVKQNCVKKRRNFGVATMVSFLAKLKKKKLSTPMLRAWRRVFQHQCVSIAGHVSVTFRGLLVQYSRSCSSKSNQ